MTRKTKGSVTHLNITVTAGPTREAIDPVRFISNRSSGRMGYAVAEAARQRGHEVTLISGPVAITPEPGINLVRVTSALDMLEALQEHLPQADVLVMAAAVSDWRPRHQHHNKIKKTISGSNMVLELAPNPDLLLELRQHKGDKIFVGFAAETGDPEEEGRRKLKAKGLDLLLANDISRPDAGFDVATNRGILFARDGTAEFWPLMEKKAMAEKLLEKIEELARSSGKRR